MYDRFTERARRVLALAEEEAKQFNHDYIGTEHILLGLVQEKKGVAATVLNNLNISLERVRLEIEKRVAPQEEDILQSLELTPKAKRVLELAKEECRKCGHNFVGTEHLLLGLLLEEEGVAAHVLNAMGVSLDVIHKEIMRLLGATEASFSSGSDMGHQKMEEGGKKQTPSLNSFGRDLTKMAIAGKIDPVIGRDAEMERLLQILGRRCKNNPVLIGEPGVGKTAIIEGIAQKIVEGSCPEVLKKKRIIILDLALMVAGTKYRGEFEGRLKATMEELRVDRNVILFIDEIHALVGAGNAEGTMDASHILKPELSRGEIQIIGATTLSEYRKYIEKDGALERRFQPIIVDPPSVEDTVKILEGLRDNYEAFHKTRFTGEAIRAAVELSDRYIVDRYLPDKAIDVIDEAGSKVRLAVTTLPEQYHELEKELKQVSTNKEEAIKNQDFELAAKLRDSERKVKKSIEDFQRKWKTKNSDSPVVDVDIIAEVVSKISGVPIQKVNEVESRRLLEMEAELKQNIIGQDEAVQSLSKAIRRSRVGLKDPVRPIGSFMFIGMTGVGKTLMAKTLAKFMFGEECSLIQFDMSEYMEKFSVSRLIGAPPGYVGYEEGGQLVEAVRRRPYSVILFDEIEKAHPDVYNLLLQILEEGHLTDSFGRRVSFSNTIVILTSNVGVEVLNKKSSMGFEEQGEGLATKEYESMKRKLLEEIKKAFRPELLNRLDDTIIFNKLSEKDVEKIVDVELLSVKERLGALDIEMSLSPKAKAFLVEEGYSPAYGARQLRRTIQKYVEDYLSEEILKGTFKKGSKVKGVYREGRFMFIPAGK